MPTSYPKRCSRAAVSRHGAGQTTAQTLPSTRIGIPAAYLSVCCQSVLGAAVGPPSASAATSWWPAVRASATRSARAS
jgi:hypothetical protein